MVATGTEGAGECHCAVESRDEDLVFFVALNPTRRRPTDHEHAVRIHTSSS